jgi:uncharacterized MnhB-related membrane protein
MMTVLQAVAFLFVAVIGTAVVLARDPLQQSMVLSFYGILLSILFLLLQAPDVALSELAVGGAAFPLMLLVALTSVRATDAAKARQEQEPDGGGGAADE